VRRCWNWGGFRCARLFSRSRLGSTSWRPPRTRHRAPSCRPPAVPFASRRAADAHAPAVGRDRILRAGALAKLLERLRGRPPEPLHLRVTLRRLWAMGRPGGTGTPTRWGIEAAGLRAAAGGFPTRIKRYCARADKTEGEVLRRSRRPLPPSPGGPLDGRGSVQSRRRPAISISLPSPPIRLRREN
jgi:hypothetical protein